MAALLGLAGLALSPHSARGDCAEAQRCGPATVQSAASDDPSDESAIALGGVMLIALGAFGARRRWPW
jgi:MYXO-CTERM domain-containing protein